MYFSFTFSGMTGEGIYRVSGFADDIEALKNLFDKGKNSLFKFINIFVVQGLGCLIVRATCSCH